MDGQFFFKYALTIQNKQKKNWDNFIICRKFLRQVNRYDVPGTSDSCKHLIRKRVFIVIDEFSCVAIWNHMLQVA